MFYHSLVSDWNHGNAHFLRGVATQLVSRGDRVRVYEPIGAWSVENLIAEAGPDAIARFHDAYPAISSTRYDAATLDIDKALRDVDLVMVHEWNDPALVAAIGRHRRRRGGYTLFFHDTHHRAASAPSEMARYDLRHYDGVLAFGRVIRDIYLRRGWARRAWTWHEAADARVFHPMPEVRRDGDLVWVGNWGDGERGEELREFLLRPAKALGLKARVYGVRYTKEARRALGGAGIRYGGWLANFDAPKVFARFRMTVHVPRRPYARRLPGIPTIRPFEAMACGIPLVSAPWRDAEHLFSPGEDFLVAHDGREMRRHMKRVLEDRSFAKAMAARALETILRRHTCAHRVDELMGIFEECGRRARRGGRASAGAQAAS